MFGTLSTLAFLPSKYFAALLFSFRANSKKILNSERTQKV